MIPSLIALVALTLILGAWMGLCLILQQGRILYRLQAVEATLQQGEWGSEAERSRVPQGLPIGTVAPAFALPNLDGQTVSLASFLGKRVLLIFFNPACGFCAQMAEELAGLPYDGADGRPVPLVLTTGDADKYRDWFEQHGIHWPVLLHEGNELASLYQANGTPMGYLIDEQGRIASPLAVGAAALLDLSETPPSSAVTGPQGEETHSTHAAMASIVRPLSESKLNRDGLPAGTPAPDFCLPRLDGGELCLQEYRGRSLLLVFSDPHCGPCDALAPHLERLSRQEGPAVIMISRGDLAENQRKVAEHGLTFPVVLQKRWELSRLYGMFTTPVAYLINAAGVIEAEVAVGVEPIRSLGARMLVPDAR